MIEESLMVVRLSKGAKSMEFVAVSGAREHLQPVADCRLTRVT